MENNICPNKNKNTDNEINTCIPESNNSYAQVLYAHKSIYGKTGIVNTGNTCYMNSAIQALCHLYPLTSFLFKDDNKLQNVLIQNANKILKHNKMYKLESNNVIPHNLKVKIHDPNYNPNTLTNDDKLIILNSTMTFQLRRLLQEMWKRNCTVQPTSFRKIFSEARNKFFAGYQQHDAEEAYSCIIQQIQEELSETRQINFLTPQNVKDFMTFRDDISVKMKNATHETERIQLYNMYTEKKREMKLENTIIESYRERRKYYTNCYSRVTEIFTGFLHSSINCPDTNCGYSSNKFDAFLHLSLELPRQFESTNRVLTLKDCLNEYCKDEQLDENNLWECEGCKKKVNAIKKLQILTCPVVLAIQLKRFGVMKTHKDNRLVHYPTTGFDVSGVVSPVDYNANKCYKYTLQCIINHRGNLHGGHYYSYCKDEDTRRWFMFNDTSVSEIMDSNIITNNAYMLFYIREDLLTKNAN